MYYSIGQVAEHCNLPQSVLRYWETVFDCLSPQKSSGGSRQYTDADVRIILRIKELLYEKGFTIKGANKQLNDMGTGPEIGATSVQNRVDRAETEPSARKSSRRDNKDDLHKKSPEMEEIVRELRKIAGILKD